MLPGFGCHHKPPQPETWAMVAAILRRQRKFPKAIPWAIFEAIHLATAVTIAFSLTSPACGGGRPAHRAGRVGQALSIQAVRLAEAPPPQPSPARAGEGEEEVTPAWTIARPRSPRSVRRHNGCRSGPA